MTCHRALTHIAKCAIMCIISMFLYGRSMKWAKIAINNKWTNPHSFNSTIYSICVIRCQMRCDSASSTVSPIHSPQGNRNGEGGRCAPICGISHTNAITLTLGLLARLPLMIPCSSSMRPASHRSYTWNEARLANDHLRHYLLGW